MGKNGRLFDCHKFRTMSVKHSGSTDSVAGDSRITPLGATLRHWKLDDYSFIKDIQMILCTVLGKKMEYAGRLFDGFYGRMLV